MQPTEIYAKCRGSERKTAYEVTANAPRYEMPFSLPSRYVQMASRLENMAAMRINNIYKERKRDIPKKITSCEVKHLLEALQSEFRARGGGEIWMNIGPNTARDLCIKLSCRCPHINSDTVSEVNKFLNDRRAKAFDLKAGDKQFHLRKAGGRIIACQGLPVPVAAQISLAMSLTHLKDLIETGCLEAAISYANNSNALTRPDMQGDLEGIFKYLAKDEPNPKVIALAAILLEMQKERKRCFVACEGVEVKKDLDLFIKESFGDYSKMVAVTNSPKNFRAKPKKAYDAAILFTPSERNIALVWNTAVSSRFALIVRHTRDDDRYWQNALKEDLEIRRDAWDPKRIKQGELLHVPGDYADPGD